MSAPDHRPPAAVPPWPQVARLREKLGGIPDMVLSLGSGLSSVARHLNLAPLASYQDLDLPHPGVPGHTGQASGGRVGNVLLLALEGRSHLYEGLTLEAVTRGMRLALAAGAKWVLQTNAAGGLSPWLNVGDIMLIKDHISLPGLCGYSPAGDAATGEYPWPRFLSQDRLYAPHLLTAATAAAEEIGLELRQGVYAMVWGPLYETPAERLLLQRLGADAVGMSTVPETVVAYAAGATVMALSVITNTAASQVPPSHEEVARVGEAACQRVAALLARLIANLGDDQRGAFPAHQPLT